MSNLFLFVKHLNKKEGAKKSDSFGLPSFYRLISLLFTSLEIFGDCAATLAPGSTLPLVRAARFELAHLAAGDFKSPVSAIPPHPHEVEGLFPSQPYILIIARIFGIVKFLERFFSSLQFEFATEEPI